MNRLGSNIVKSVELTFIGEMAESKANLDVFLENPVGVGEHSDITNEVKILVEKIANAKDALEVISEVKKNDNC